MIYGIDVSRYQQDINWTLVKKDGIEFAIIKAMSESKRTPDPKFYQNYDGCKENGIKQGIYIYMASRSLQDPKGEANRVLEILDGRKLPYRLWFDLEDRSLRAAGKDRINNIVNIETAIFKQAGYKVGIYSNRDWFANVLDKSILIDKPFWCARYPLGDTGVIVERLSPQKYAQAWQYSSKGNVKGIKGNVDRDVDFVGLDTYK